MAAGWPNLVDSSGWIEYFTDGPNADVFAEPLADISRLIVPTVCVYEVFRVVLRQRGEPDALRAAALMGSGREIALTSALALAAARLAHEHALAMADGINLATALLGPVHTTWVSPVAPQAAPIKARGARFGQRQTSDEQRRVARPAAQPEGPGPFFPRTALSLAHVTLATPRSLRLARKKSGSRQGQPR